MERRSKPPSELTALPNLHRVRQTGPRRTRRPIYLDRLPPCNQACPAGENVQAWLALAQEGRFRQAWEELMKNNPLPAVHGRVCYHPCEDACNRGQLDETVSVHAVERFLGDLALAEGWQVKLEAQPSGKRVLVVGAGPGGLSAAYHLLRLGHAVEVRDAGPLAGGMMHFGIPQYRLPRDVLEAEIGRIAELGAKITLNHKVEDVLQEQQEGGFDAVFLALGAHLSRRVEIPARDAGKVLDAVGFLKGLEAGPAPQLGRRVAVYGGGNTAIDAARSAARLGAEPIIIYRRTRRLAPAHDFEVAEAQEEGIKVRWLRTIKRIDRKALTVEKMRLNAEGWPESTGEYETLEADSLILALGQETDTEFLKKIPGMDFKEDGTVVVNEQLMTGHAGIFAGGDMSAWDATYLEQGGGIPRRVPAERTVTVAVGHGKRAARCIDAFLRGERYRPPQREPAPFELLHPWFYSDAARRQQSRIDVKARRSSFAEVVGGLSEDEALYEARRCLACGNCFECDGCYGACPEGAIIKLGPGRRYEFDYERCTGCAVCYEQCPCGAITMLPEAS